MTDKQIKVELSLIEWVYLTLGCVAQQHRPWYATSRVKRLAEHIDRQISAVAPVGSVRQCVDYLAENFYTNAPLPMDAQHVANAAHSIMLTTSDIVYFVHVLASSVDKPGKFSLLALPILLKLKQSVTVHEILNWQQILLDEQRDVYPEIIGD